MVFLKRIIPISLFLLLLLIFLSGCTENTPANSSCSEDWRCAEWSACSNGQQARQCTDLSNCGTEASKPSELKNCSADLCSGISCPNKCEGTTLMKNGACVSGTCKYTATENSPDCGYSAAELDFNTTLRFCEYSIMSKEFSFFFSIETIGEKNPERGASVWLITGNPSYNTPSFKIQRPYTKTDILWNETMWSGIPYKGNQWKIWPAPSFEAFDYRLIYCMLATGESCSESNGIVLYSGNTANDCNQVSF